MYDRYEQEPQTGIDCIALTLNAELHLKETLDTWYKEAPIRRLLVIDGDSKDQTRDILVKYPRVTIWIKSGMTTGKAFELLKEQATTHWMIWIDIGKIPANGWYDTMLKHKNEGDILGSIRVNYKDGRYWNDPVILDPTKRFLGGPLFIRTEILRTYHVEDDYTQRCFDIVMRRQMEDIGGRYALVSSTSHKCYLPIPVTDKKELMKRHDMNARGIVKYIPPEYAESYASYLLDDHWMLMMNKLPESWIQEMNPGWIPVLKRWRMRRLIIAKTERLLYGCYKKIGGWLSEKREEDKA